ncbi:uncharacterized protein LOC105427315 [Pogonomyrmex barbatus]|uniref:Uncharacterized protein LOC105427315 n=1 Tax=Pogonomyrmex barbatus TaxID=144034 RepID=A0A6I9W6N2_9HYME|nr:uncharacterized protein LOC105427315 [Pogonomyrmex barbatus]
MRLGRAWRAIRLCQVAKRARHGILCLQTRSCRIMTIVPGLPSVLWRAVHLTRNFSWDRVTRDIWRFGQYRGYGRRFEELDNTVKKPRPKTVPVPKITLVSPDNSITVTVLEEAQRLAKRRNFTLVKVSDLENKTQRPLYKLVNSTDILEKTDTIEATQDADETIQIKSNKYTKLLYVSAKIAEHDLRTKMKNLVKLLIKGYKTKVIITLDGVEGQKRKIVRHQIARRNL